MSNQVFLENIVLAFSIRPFLYVVVACFLLRDCKNKEWWRKISYFNVRLETFFV